MSISRSPSDAVRRILRTARRAPDMVHNAGAAHTPGGQARSRPMGRSRGQRRLAPAFQDCQHRRMRAARATLVTGQDGVATPTAWVRQQLWLRSPPRRRDPPQYRAEEGLPSNLPPVPRGVESGSLRARVSECFSPRATTWLRAPPWPPSAGGGQHANLSLEGLVVARWQGCRGRSASVGEFRLD